MINQEFIKVAKQLHATPDDEVVKVAGLLNKIKNLFKQIANPYYRQAVSNMQLEGGAMSDAAQHLNKHLAALTQAIKDGDVQKYRKAKHSIDSALNMFINAKERVDSKADNLFAMTVKETQEPGFIDSVAKIHAAQNPEFTLEQAKAYEGQPLDRYAQDRNVKDIYVHSGEGTTVTRMLLRSVAKALSSLHGLTKKNDIDKFVKENFSDENYTNLISSFKSAVMGGEITGVKTADSPKVGGDHFLLDIKTAPFEVPGGAKIQADITLIDRRGDISSKSRISMFRNNDYQFIEGPQEDIKPEMEVAKDKTNPDGVSDSIDITDQLEDSLEESLEDSVKEEVTKPKAEPPKGLADLIMQNEEPVPETEPMTEELRAKSSISDIYDDITKTAERVPYTINKLSELEFAQAMREGYKLAFGSDPTLEVLASGWSQAVLESGRPIKLPNNNVGNIKAAGSWEKSGSPYFVKKTGEYTKDGRYYIQEGTKWRAYATPAQGAAGYWKLLGGRYNKAIEWMAAGDPKSASVALGLNGYYTAPIDKYAGAVDKIYSEFMKRVAPKMSDLRSEPKAAPGPKPAVKKWHKDYSQEERESILKGGEAPAKDNVRYLEAPKETDTSDTAIDSLITKLVASPVTNLVKRAILSNKLPTSSALVMISSYDATPMEKMEYARVAASVINQHLDIDARVCRKEDEIEIKCSGLGSEMKVAGAIQAVCDMVASEMKQQVGTRLYATAIAGGFCKMSEVNSDALIKNRKKFNMRRIANVSA